MKYHKDSALILLSTYNGERYLPEQLDSLMTQSHTNWELVIRDDGSSDNTLNVLREYASKDERLHLLQDNAGNLNSCGSFSLLMEYALNRDEPYIFFADQDDVWLPTKIEKSIKQLQELESQYGAQTPALVHTDLQVVNESLKPIHPSYLRYERLNRNVANPIKTLLINNYVTGCTTSINRSLLEIATPVPRSAFMHDWWCAICAAAIGHIGFIDQATILYRQHQKNAIGSHGLIGKLKDLITFKKTFTKRISNLRSCFAQAQELLKRINFSNSHHELIESFVALPDSKLGTRYTAARDMKLTPASKLRAAVFLFMIAFV